MRPASVNVTVPREHLIDDPMWHSSRAGGVFRVKDTGTSMLGRRRSRRFWTRCKSHWRSSQETYVSRQETKLSCRALNPDQLRRPDCDWKSGRPERRKGRQIRRPFRSCFDRLSKTCGSRRMSPIRRAYPPPGSRIPQDRLQSSWRLALVQSPRQAIGRHSAEARHRVH